MDEEEVTDDEANDCDQVANYAQEAQTKSEPQPAWYFVDVSRVRVSSSYPNGGPIVGGTPLLDLSHMVDDPVPAAQAYFNKHGVSALLRDLRAKRVLINGC